MIPRIVLTVIALACYALASALYNPQATLLAGQIAGRQFENSDGAYLTTSYAMHMVQGVGFVFTLLLLAFLIMIWAGPIARGVRNSLIPVLFAAITLVGVTEAKAFFEKADRTEAYTVMPNESAFWIPDTGANKETQAQLDSEGYLNQNKLAVKRFVIPHSKLSNSGGYMAWDYYVPTGRLIILDRTKFSREWVDAEDRGTSKSKEGFPCQSKEGLNVIAGVSIGTSVTEANAAKFLYNFGVNPPKGDRTDGNVIFTSVYYGRSLKEVMDDVGRKKVQTLVCNEVAKRSFDEVNAQSLEMMDEIQKASQTYFASVGVTLDFIGWGDSFEFDPPVQKVVNDKYAADTLGPLTEVLAALAQLKVQEGLGKGLEAKGLPMVVTPDMINALIGLATKAPPQ